MTSLLSLLELKHEGKKLQKKYQIEVLSVTPERVRLASPYWVKNEKLLRALKDVIAPLADIKSVRITPQIGTVTIEFTIPKEVPMELLRSLEAQFAEIYQEQGVWV